MDYRPKSSRNIGRKSADFITGCIEKPGFPEREASKRIQFGELQKNLIFLKKSVDKLETAWYYKQALERAAQKTGLDDSAAKHFVN